VVLQDTLLFAASAHDNIAYGAPGATAKDVEAAARLANAHRFIEALPQGYDTLVGERGATLSGGQRQRISLARAAVRHSPLLILDEPTASLDEENARLVTEALERISVERTTLLVSHDLDLVSRADLILYVDGGRIVERGTHAELLRANGRYAYAYRLQTFGREAASVAG
jgi:ATP-binding cassette subfamily B protein